MLKSERAAARVSDPIAPQGSIRAGADLWASQGRSCARRGDLFNALQCFQRSLESDLDCPVAWLGLSDVFRTLNDPKRADACRDIARRISGRVGRVATA